HTHTNAHTHTHTHTNAHTHAHKCTHTHIHTHTHKCMSAGTHTHTHTEPANKHTLLSPGAEDVAVCAAVVCVCGGADVCAVPLADPRCSSSPRPAGAAVARRVCGAGARLAHTLLPASGKYVKRYRCAHVQLKMLC